MEHINFKINNIQNGAMLAAEIIKLTLSKNKIKKDIDIKYDYQIKDAGLYYPDADPLSLLVNPDNCKPIEDYNKGSQLFYFGYVRDSTMTGTLIHEFCHFLIFNIFWPQMKDNFKKVFPTKRLYLNEYSNTNIDEEMAETLTLYIVNPYLLKLISKEHYFFFKEYLESPVQSSSKRFRKIYEGFPYEIKEELKNKWGIVLNIATNRFVKEKVNAVNKSVIK